MMNAQTPQSDTNSFNTTGFNLSINTNINNQNISIVESNKEPIDSNSTQTSYEQTKTKIELYVNALVHSTHCTSDVCSFPKCLQFKRVIRHNQTCKKFINDRCEFCRQLIAISVYHAKNCSNHAHCKVPFCMTIKQKLEINKSIEFATKYLKVLRFKQQKSQSLQVSVDSLMNNESHKRKFSCLELDNSVANGTSVTSLIDDHFEEKNLEMQKLKDSFYDKLKEIKDMKLNQQTDIRQSNQITLSKLSREKIFSTLLQDQILANYPKLKTTNTHYADLMVLLLRKEVDLNSFANSMNNYLYLLVKLLHELDKKLLKHKEMKSVESQTEPCLSEESTIGTSRDMEIPCKKRIKIE